MNAEGNKSIFFVLIDNIQLIIDDIKHGDLSRRSADPEFRLDVFWTRISACMQATSDAATRLCLAYSPTPLTSDADAEPLITGLERSALALTSIYYTLPLSHGMTLNKYVSHSVLGMLEAAQSLLRSISSSAAKTKGKGSKKAVQSTGHTWEYADKFSKLPKDNSEAVLARANDAAELIVDALMEMEEALAGAGMAGEGGEEEGDDDILDCRDDPSTAGWSDADRLVAMACLGLVKTAKNSVKKLTEALSSVGHDASLHHLTAAMSLHDSGCQQGSHNTMGDRLDAIAVQLAELSPAVDELVSCLYPPVRLSTVHLNCQRLADVIRSTLNSCRTGLLSSSDSGDAVSTGPAEDDKNRKWIDFLSGVVDHNLSKVEQLINGMQSSLE